jgi:tRNA(Ile)-lysidine synthase
MSGSLVWMPGREHEPDPRVRTCVTGVLAAAGDPVAPWRAALAAADLAAPVVVACSGGADSVALLALAVDAQLAPVAVHVDHGVRADSAADADRVRAIAASLGAAARVERVAVDAGPNFEARARDARYAALERARGEVGAEVVLVGHTADDQAETVLLNVLRGAAGAGLSGMSPRHGRVVRPLLGLRRSETRAVCAALAIEPVADPMNDDRAFRRVAIRHDVLPLLSQVAERDLVPVLARQAAVMRAESEYLDELAEAAWPNDSTALASALRALPLPLARRAVRCWLGDPPPSFAEVERVLAVANGDARAVELAGGRVVRRSAGVLSVMVG